MINSSGNWLLQSPVRPSWTNCTFSFCSGPNRPSHLPCLVKQAEDETRAVTASFPLVRGTITALYVAKIIEPSIVLPQELPLILLPVGPRVSVQGPLHLPLDDSLVVAPLYSGVCRAALDCMLTTCQSLGVPLVADKIAAPATTLVFLGIDLHTECMEVRLPDDKPSWLCKELQQWAAWKCCRHKEHEYLLGILNFDCTVLPSGRPSCGEWLLLHSTNDPNCFLRLNAVFRSDLAWWLAFSNRWNGVFFLQLSGSAEPSVVFYTDASGSWGCGAIWGSDWLQGQWPLQWADMSIMIKELVPVLCAAAVRGHSWVGLHVLCYSDNMSVAHALNKGSSREPSGVAMHLLRTLTFFQPFLGLSYELNMWLALTMAPPIQFQELTCPYFLLFAPHALYCNHLVKLYLHMGRWCSKELSLLEKASSLESAQIHTALDLLYNRQIVNELWHNRDV